MRVHLQHLGVQRAMLHGELGVTVVVIGQFPGALDVNSLVLALCRVVSIKLKDEQTSYTPKNYYGKKVWTVNARDVAYVELEHYPTAERVIAL